MEGDTRPVRGPVRGPAAPCKACTEFESWSSEMAKKNDLESAHLYAECPLDKNELGRNTWSFLHTMAAYYPDTPSRDEQKKMTEFINSFSLFYPCHVCAEHLREDLKIAPPKVESSKELSQWLCQVHNKVNIRLGKSVFDCSRVKERWRDGWKDGSCE